MRAKVLVTRKIFDDALTVLSRHVDVEANQRDLPLTQTQLVRKLQGKAGALTQLSSTFDEKTLSQCPDLKIISNVAVAVNNIDVKACTRRGIMVTNTPGVLDETTADFAWCLLLATARRLVEADNFLRSGKWKG